MQSSALQFALSVLTVIIFTGLTAYDTQRIKTIYYQFSGNAEAVAKSAVMGDKENQEKIEEGSFADQAVILASLG